MLRICRARDIKSTIKYANHSCTRRAKNSQDVAENILNRQFYADKPNEKWLTDVTEFKWYDGTTVHKLYLSAILDLYDRRIVSYVLSERNDNPLVYKTFDKAVKANPDAHPLFHSDRGFQYTGRAPKSSVATARLPAGLCKKLFFPILLTGSGSVGRRCLLAFQLNRFKLRTEINSACSLVALA